MTFHAPFVPARSIDEVLSQLDAIIEQAIFDRDRRGYFAVLYRTVTAAVKQGIAAGRFEDGPRMERLDIAFANRYLHAYDNYRRGAQPSKSWLVAFEAGSSRRVVILQHLLLGMNAHINLDLGIAAAEVCPGDAIAALEHDFNEINTVLATLETAVEAEVCSLSPWIDRLDHIDPRAGRVVANFSIDRARACSWKAAQRLAALSGAERDRAIEDLDAEIALLARIVERPLGFMINLNLVLVRLRETWDARKVMEVLNGKMAARVAS
ncbi:MAG TPA: DUF5995 family protein [Gemmatimonadaceae bacterium]|nr:DUF5995 family protein [Gemmatimonadaceae bacterium]